MLQEGRRRYKDVDFGIGDAYNLEFEDNAFDTCLLLDVLQHVPDYRPLVMEAVRVACKYVVIITWWTVDKEINMYEGDMISKKIHRMDFIKFIEGLDHVMLRNTDEIAVLVK